MDKAPRIVTALSGSPAEQESTKQPTVTLVVIPRERFSHTEASLESIYQNTDYPFALVYVDGNSPARVADFLRKTSIERDFRLIRTEHFLSNNQARNLGLTEVRAEYVVFIDNDCEVEPGWLRHLVNCAVETGAWAVTPLYFLRTPSDQTIHTAGGTTRIIETDGVRTLSHDQSFTGRRYDDVSAELHRAENDEIEFHCVLLRADAIRALGALDEELLSMFEHEDLSLQIQGAGGTIFAEPAAKVNYVVGPLDSFDIEFARLRWSDDWNRQSTRHFRQKWGLDKHFGGFDIDWANAHRRRLTGERRSPAGILDSGIGRVGRRLRRTSAYARLRRSRYGARADAN